jgi:hypothetical protein
MHPVSWSHPEGDRKSGRVNRLCFGVGFPDRTIIETMALIGISKFYLSNQSANLSIP